VFEDEIKRSGRSARYPYCSLGCMTSPNSLKESTPRSQTSTETQRAQEEESLTHGELKKIKKER